MTCSSCNSCSMMPASTTKKAELPFTLAFKKQTRDMGFVRLRYILAAKEKTIMDKPEFTHTWFSELVWFAMDKQFVNLLEADHRF